jgi:hypothetical protein
MSSGKVVGFFAVSSSATNKMFCPECKAEYRSGFTRCSDCEVDLVEHLPELLPESHPIALPDASLESALTTEDRAECVCVCEQFKAAGVPFKVIQRKHQFFKGVDEHFEIRVPADFRNKAKEIIEKGRFDFTDSPEDQRVMGLPAEDCPTVEHDHWNPSWHPEEATVEVWSENTEERAWMIEASLRENHVHARTDVSGNGSRRILVMPEDEDRAREIVREVRDGSPPK